MASDADKHGVLLRHAGRTMVLRHGQGRRRWLGAGGSTRSAVGRDRRLCPEMTRGTPDSVIGAACEREWE